MTTMIAFFDSKEQQGNAAQAAKKQGTRLWYLGEAAPADSTAEPRPFILFDGSNRMAGLTMMQHGAGVCSEV
jgi:hypothetical protein